jgi:hypothetical protein
MNKRNEQKILYKFIYNCRCRFKNCHFKRRLNVPQIKPFCTFQYKIYVHLIDIQANACIYIQNALKASFAISVYNVILYFKQKQLKKG